MTIAPGGLAVAHFNTSVGGIDTPADTAVSASVIRNDTVTSIIPTIANISPSHYVVSFTVPGNWVGYDKALVAFTTTHMAEQRTCTKEVGSVAAAGLDDALELSIDRVLDLLEADQVIAGGKIRHLLAGTSTVLLEKDIAGTTCADNVSLTQ